MATGAEGRIRGKEGRKRRGQCQSVPEMVGDNAVHCWKGGYGFQFGSMAGGVPKRKFSDDGVRAWNGWSSREGAQVDWAARKLTTPLATPLASKAEGANIMPSLPSTVCDGDTGGSTQPVPRPLPITTEKSAARLRTLLGILFWVILGAEKLKVAKTGLKWPNAAQSLAKNVQKMGQK
eukprot:EG_transcript_35182